MLEETELRSVAKHTISHDMGMCTCPCFTALIKVSEKLTEERELMRKLGSVSPIALAAVIGSDLTHLEEEDDSDVE